MFPRNPSSRSGYWVLERSFPWQDLAFCFFYAFKGVMIGISKRLPGVSNKVIIDVNGQFVFLQGHMGNEEISILKLYTPNNNQKGFGRELRVPF